MHFFRKLLGRGTREPRVNSAGKVVASITKAEMKKLKEQHPHYQRIVLASKLANAHVINGAEVDDMCDEHKLALWLESWANRIVRAGWANEDAVFVAGEVWERYAVKHEYHKSDDDHDWGDDNEDDGEGFWMGVDDFDDVLRRSIDAVGGEAMATSVYGLFEEEISTATIPRGGLSLNERILSC